MKTANPTTRTVTPLWENDGVDSNLDYQNDLIDALAEALCRHDWLGNWWERAEAVLCDLALAAKELEANDKERYRRHSAACQRLRPS